MRRLFSALLLGLTFAAGCSHEELFTFEAVPLEQTPEKTEFTITPLTGQLVVGGYFQACTNSSLHPSLEATGSSLTIVVTDRGCKPDPGTPKLWSYRVIWTGLKTGKVYQLRIEHRGEAGLGDHVVYDEAIATL